jgi:hypothetical protein
VSRPAARRSEPRAPSDAASSDPPARIVDSDGRAKVYRPLPEERRRAAREAGLEAYAEGRFFEAHELMEPAWMGSADAADRDLDQGLIKLAAAYVHAGRGNALGMRKNLEGARKRLAAVVDRHGPAGEAAMAAAAVDARPLLEQVETRLEVLDGLHADESAVSWTATDLLRRLPPPRIPRLAHADHEHARASTDAGE